MQQGANSATPPARKAANTEPVVSRLLMWSYLPRLCQTLFELAPGKPAIAEVLPIQQDQGTHRRPMLVHQRPPGLPIDRHHANSHRIRLRQDCQGGLRVLTQVTRG